MLNNPTIRIRPLSEDVFTEIIELAGGRRAYADHINMTMKNADYILGDAVIELKILDDDSLKKRDRQKKLSHLFNKKDPNRPVHVLDRNLLDPNEQKAYGRAMETPIKNAVRTAKGQLAQSRSQFPNTNCSILMLVNNANTALDHDEILEMAGRRARNDTSNIDGVVVAGAYLHSDGFDTYARWLIDYVPINLDRPFRKYIDLKNAFETYSETAMKAAILEGLSKDMTKGPISDNSFVSEGKTFVKPAPPLGGSSDYYNKGRPRLNTTGIEKSPVVGLTFPNLNRSEWEKFRSYMPEDLSLGMCFSDWIAKLNEASSDGTPLKPFVPVNVTLDGWINSLGDTEPPQCFESVKSYANQLYQEAVLKVIEGSGNNLETKIVPSSYILAVTEIIGQDEANDVSHIFFVNTLQKLPLVQNERIFHRYALTLGASYAVKHNVASLRWVKDTKYAWK